MSEFQSYRATTKIHLSGTHISEKEVVEFDGCMLKRADGTDLKLEYPSAFKGAINAGWVVLDGEKVIPYTPKPAGVEVRSAQANGTDRDIISVDMVHEEDQDVGTVGSVREATAAAAAAAAASDGQVVGRMKSSAKSDPVRVGVEDRRVVKEIESSTDEVVEKVAVATGDVEEARTGDELSDLLPNAATSGKPEATFSSGSSSVGSGEEGVVVATVSPPQDLDWDMSPHWKVRAKRAIELYKDNLPVLQAVMAIEKRGVQKEILRQLYAE